MQESWNKLAHLPPTKSNYNSHRETHIHVYAISICAEIMFLPVRRLHFPQQQRYIGWYAYGRDHMCPADGKMLSAKSNVAINSPTCSKIAGLEEFLSKVLQSSFSNNAHLMRYCYSSNRRCAPEIHISTSLSLRDHHAIATNYLGQGLEQATLEWAG